MARIRFILYCLQALPEHSLFLIIACQFGHPFRIFAVSQTGGQFFECKFILLSFGGLAFVNLFFEAQVSIETDQGRSLIGIQVTFKLGTDFIAHQTSAVVTFCVSVDKRLGSHNVPEFRCNV